jgi:putative transposase
MVRIARAVAVGIPHHVTQRGNYRQVIFVGDDDYRQHLEWLKYYRDRTVVLALQAGKAVMQISTP